MIKLFLLFCTGLVLFLFGMFRLSATVRERFAGSRMREYFRLSVKTPLYGVVTGFVATILFQSSSATSVITVGLVSAGLIDFFHSLGIILGADIGTTVTVQLVVWKITDASPVLIIFGSLLWISGRNKWKHVGEALFYFGLIFFGLSLVSQATAPLKSHPELMELFKQARNPLVGVFVGLMITAVVQSSAIPIAILVILAQYNLVTIDSALPVVFGANLGTAATALLAALTANINGKRTALSHFLFKLTGVVICMAVLPFFIPPLEYISASVAQQIALGHFFFNLIIVIIFVPLLTPFTRMVERLMPGSEEVLSLWPEYLDEKCLEDPGKAFECVRQELVRQFSVVGRMFAQGIDLINHFHASQRQNVHYIEMVVDTLRKEIGIYLCKISRDALSADLSRKLFLFDQVTDDIERIGDHIFSISELSRRKHRRKISFTDDAREDLAVFITLVHTNLDEAASLITRKDNKIIENIFAREEEIDAMEKDLKERHLERFYRRICHPEAGPIFIEMLIHLERISDHCENIAEHIQDLKEL